MADSSTPSTPDQPDQRRTILDAAITVLQRQGAAGLTVRNVAQEAGCSTTGVYTWFGGKPGLVEAIFVEGFRSFDRALGGAYASDDLLEAGRAYRRWALANRTHYLVMFGGAVPDFEPSPEACERADRSFAGLVDAVSQALPLTDEQEAATWAYHLFATVHGYVMLDLMPMGTPGTEAERDARYEAGLARILPNP